MSVAFLYPGQGSQKAGMAEAVLASDAVTYERYAAAAEEASGLPVRRLSLDGPVEELTRTEVAQPALFALSLALTDIAREAGFTPAVVAGHSLGEYTAAVAAGALAPDDGTRLVARRGQLMAAVQEQRPGAMAAIMGLDEGTVADVCSHAAEHGSVGLANLNTPEQLVVSGEEQAVAAAMRLAGEAGAAHVTRLPVGSAFHSELMAPVQEQLAAEMAGLEWRDLEVPLIGNAAAQPVRRADDVRRALVAQIAQPVRWTDCVRRLRDDGVRTALELGPGRVLAGLVKRTCPEIRVLPAGSREAIERAAERLAPAATA